MKNIEETEKAKQILAEARRERRNADEEHLVATRCKLFSSHSNWISCRNLTALCSFLVFRPNMKQKSDEDFIRDAKREAMGLRADKNGEQRGGHHHQDRKQTATDEMVSAHFSLSSLLLIKMG